MNSKEAEDRIIQCFYTERLQPLNFLTFRLAIGSKALATVIRLQDQGRIQRRNDGRYVLTDEIAYNKRGFPITPKQAKWFSKFKQLPRKKRQSKKPKQSPPKARKPKQSSPGAGKAMVTQAQKPRRANGKIRTLAVDAKRTINRGSDRYYSLMYRIINQTNATAYTLSLIPQDYPFLQRLLDEGFVKQLPGRPIRYSAREENLEYAIALDKERKAA